ncbi:AP-4 complex subunit beta-1-like isoform X2 [Mercenaria mercenaria]|nr:AP-4 complex subunit beta-1-like isoform X2 [Mercenaria mercenaria]
MLQYSLTKSVDFSIFLPAIVNLMAHSDLLIKKSACQLLTRVSGMKSEFILLAVNTLLKDTRESNPVIRALAIRTLCAINHEAFVEHRIKCVTEGLKDTSSYVRRTAVMSSITVFKAGTEGFQESGIINRLYELIRDSDPIVTVDSLLALEEILKNEGGIVLNKKIVGYLLTRVEELTPWGMASVSKLMQKYTPKSEDEIFDLMNVLDPFLEHNSVTLSLNTLQLFLGIIKDLPHLQEEVLQRSLSVFLTIFSSGNPELISTTIQFCKQYPQSCKILAPNYKNLFCKFKDPAYLKVQKLQFITEMINVENFKDILEEIVINCTNASAEVSLCAIQSLGNIVTSFPDLSEKLLKAFNKLLQSDKDHVVSNTLQVLVKLSEKNQAALNELGDQLCVIARKLSDNDGRSSALYLIAQMDNGSSESLFVIEDFIEQFDDLDAEVKSQLLLTGIKMFFRRPAEFQNILGELFDLCLREVEPRELNQQARFYYSIFEANVDTAKQIFEVL